jgi:hypothetical protein
MGVDIDDMDADVTGEDYGEEEEWDGTEEMRKKKIQEYMDEVYGLDFNDMVLFTSSLFHSRNRTYILSHGIGRRPPNALLLRPRPIRNIPPHPRRNLASRR